MEFYYIQMHFFGRTFKKKAVKMAKKDMTKIKFFLPLQLICPFPIGTIVFLSIYNCLYSICNSIPSQFRKNFRCSPVEHPSVNL